jgi:hypothetical protein
VGIEQGSFGTAEQSPEENRADPVNSIDEYPSFKQRLLPLNLLGSRMSPRCKKSSKIVYAIDVLDIFPSFLNE